MGHADDAAPGGDDLPLAPSAERALAVPTPPVSVTPRPPGEFAGGNGAAGAGLLPEDGALSIEPDASITQFMTDGSLARLCDELARLTRVPIWLRAPDGRVVVPAHDDGRGRLWREVDERDGAARAFALVDRPFDPHADLFVAPIRVRTVGSQGADIGAIVMPADWGRDDPQARRALERALQLLAGTAIESCEDQALLRRRVHELDALFRLSSLMARAGDPDQLLQAALDLALDVLRLDAGTIAVLDAETAPLHVRCSRGLGPEFLARTTPISGDGSLRARALMGEVVVVEDLLRDPRIADHQRAADEGLASLISTGLIFQGRAAGLMRLYSRTRRRFSEQDVGLLRSIADQAAMALAHARLRQLREEDQQINRQVRLAADVQRRMLPRILPDLPPLEIAARYAPSFHLGGDFYDLFQRRGELVMAVCDVVGKGVPAALLMSAVRAALRAFTQEALGLDEVMSRINRALARDTLESEFATLWLGLADPVSLRLTYCGAGHDPPLIFRVPAHRTPTMADVDELSAGGMVLGVDPSQRYALGSFELRPRDLLLAYTDGLSEAADFQGRAFGKDRIKRTVLELLETEPEATAPRVVEHLTRALRQFTGLRASRDDVTLVVLKVRETSPATMGEGI